MIAEVFIAVSESVLFKGLELNCLSNLFNKLPESWAVATINDVAKIDSNLVDPANFQSYPHVAPNHIESGTGRLLKYQTIAEDAVTSSKHLFFPGHIIYSKIRPYLAKAVIVDFEGLCSADMYPISANIDTAYLHRWLISTEFTHLVSQSQGRTVLPKVNQTALKKIIVPLPPLKEQHRIVKKIQSLTTRSRKAREALDAIPPLLDQFRQSVLAAAFRGDLTADWRAENLDVESGKKFWSSEKKNSNNWAIMPLKEACIKVQSGSTPKGKPFTLEGEVPFLKVYNLVEQKISFNYKPQYVSHDIHENKLKRSITLPGDVLMNIVGPPMGKVALVTSQFPEWNINQALVTFRPKEGLLSEYLYYFLCEGYLVRSVTNETKGIVGQVNISLTQCRESLISIPSINEQKEIVKRVRNLLSLFVQLQDIFRGGLDDLEQLDQSILAKAFRGDLVPQDPTDEPAHILLNRIRTEREKTQNAKKKTKRKKKR